jgi:putative redox protein
MAITAKRTGQPPLACDIGIGTHVITADEPIAVGGDDLGPGPHDLFDAALAACTSMTVRMYAQRKQWPLTDVLVSIVRDDHDERNGIYRLSRTIELQGALDAEQRTRLIEIANHCPIHRLMHAKIEIDTVEHTP